jgi:hypothetical protein
VRMHEVVAPVRPWWHGPPGGSPPDPLLTPSASLRLLSEPQRYGWSQGVVDSADYGGDLVVALRPGFRGWVAAHRSISFRRHSRPMASSAIGSGKSS